MAKGKTEDKVLVYIHDEEFDTWALVEQAEPEPPGEPAEPEPPGG